MKISIIKSSILCIICSGLLTLSCKKKDSDSSNEEGEQAVASNPVSSAISVSIDGTATTRSEQDIFIPLPTGVSSVEEPVTFETTETPPFELCLVTALIADHSLLNVLVIRDFASPEESQFIVVRSNLTISDSATETTVCFDSYDTNATYWLLSTEDTSSFTQYSASMLLSYQGLTIASGTTIDFGVNPASFDSLNLSLNVTNTGSIPLNLSELSIVGADSADFSVVNAPEALAAGASAPITLGFDPAASSGSLLESQFSFSSDASNLSAFSLSLSGMTSWLGSFVDGGAATSALNKDTNIEYFYPDAIVFNDKLYLTSTYAAVYDVRVQVYNGNDDSPLWPYVDGDHATNGINKNSGATAYQSSFEVFNDKLYVTWSEDSGVPYQTRVAVYNGDDISPTWNFVDGDAATGLNKDSSRSATEADLVTFNNKLYITWQETNGTQEQIRVAVYSGNDSSATWDFIDGDGANGINFDTGNDATFPEFIVFNNKLYLTWREDNGSGQIRVTVYDGNESSPSWNFVDGNTTNGINKDVVRNADKPYPFVYRDKLYITFTEENASSVGQIRIAVYDGDDDSPSWSFVDGNGVNGINWDTGEYAYNPNVAVHNDRVYIAWQEDNPPGSPIRLAVYNGNDSAPSWEIIDGGTAQGMNYAQLITDEPELISYNGKLYLIWAEEDGANIEQLRVKVSQP